MIDTKVTNIKNISKKNFPYIVTWIIYYAWVLVFVAWWTESPLKVTIYGTENRVMIHSLYLISSAIFVFFIKRRHFKKVAIVGGIFILINLFFHIFTKVELLNSSFFNSVSMIMLAVSIGIVNIAVMIPFIYVLNNTEKFYSVVLSNLLICILVFFEEIDFLSVGNNFVASTIMLVLGLVPVLFFKSQDYFIEKKKCFKNVPSLTKAVYITIVINCCYAIFCKGVGRAFVLMANELVDFNLNILFYIGGMIGCILYVFIYHFFKRCYSTVWNIIFSTFAVAMFVYAIGNTLDTKLFFAVLVGIGSSMGMINMYYIIGVIAKKYWSSFYVKISTVLIGVCGSTSGVLLGNYLTKNNNVGMSIFIAFISILIIILLLAFSPTLALMYYDVKWQEDSTKGVIDNLDLRKFKNYNLTPREIDICKLLVKNLTNRQMGATLGISENTVNSYRKEIYKKLNINCKEELVEKFK